MKTSTGVYPFCIGGTTFEPFVWQGRRQPLSLGSGFTNKYAKLTRKRHVRSCRPEAYTAQPSTRLTLQYRPQSRKTYKETFHHSYGYVQPPGDGP